jgi:hypothetical protein
MKDFTMLIFFFGMLCGFVSALILMRLAILIENKE